MIQEELLAAVQAATENVIQCGDWNRYEGNNSEALKLLIAETIGQVFVQLTSSGTAGLEIILRAAGLSVADEVMLSSYDYPGNFWAIERVGARPVLVDTEPSNWRVNQESLNEVFRPACKALIVSHLHGQLQRMNELLDWCNARNVLLIEDACQALGASWQSKPIGSYGHATILSFGGGKLLSCGRGGAWATSNEALAVRARVASGAGSGPYAISELQAAVTRAQWPWLGAINESCRTFFRDLNLALCSADRNSPSLQTNHADGINEGWRLVSEDCIDHTAYYQCGWLIPSMAEHECQRLIADLRRVPRTGNASEANDVQRETGVLPFGAGFPGFHRRSRKRCRIETSLTNASDSAARTLVLHHGIALQQKWSASEIASWIKKNRDQTIST